VAPGIQPKKFQARAGRYQFVVGYVDIPVEALQRLPVDEIFNAERDTVCQACQGRVVSEKEIALGPHRGKEFVFEARGGRERLLERVYVVKSDTAARFYSLGADGPGLNLDGEEVQKFCNSFRVTGLPAARPPAGGAPPAAGSGPPPFDPGIPPPPG
jgi:hypothetical protein